LCPMVTDQVIQDSLDREAGSWVLLLTNRINVKDISRLTHGVAEVDMGAYMAHDSSCHPHFPGQRKIKGPWYWREKKTLIVVNWLVHLF
jgi:hypothetical protein